MKINTIGAIDFANNSNQIEGERDDKRIKTFTIEATKRVLKNEITCLEDILYLHGLMTKGLYATWGGKLRDCDVYIGGKKCMNALLLPMVMESYFKDFKKMDSFKAHNEFERIHPFQDFNGRIGRLIWLSKAYHEEGYNFGLSFLHTYYYQTLNNENK